MARRAGWGLRPGELDELVAAGTDTVLDRMVEPAAGGIPAEPSPWEGLDHDDDPERRQEQVLA
ncbi:MAG: hypothetical protein GWN07_35475, partial [Actinobacteria bacterium]|nr:DUF1800 domain-containing protein [Actinomycetota bacterium]NIU70719.1 DUF1800 domain-containing protein [Actinomycetota bacterium]NIW32620.1 hypothetical protein [Actinomycetota bacterium]NIX24825.1 hypothetical protein [Actinomycetota bacterium]